MTARRASPPALQQRVRVLGPWFHNLRLGRNGSVQTAPAHPLGNLPADFWRHFAHAVPEGLTGWSVLDVGCNAGFFSFEIAREQLGLDVEFRRLEAYDVGRLAEGPFDLVLFLGVFYHLRHPLFGQERVCAQVRRRLLFQTMGRGSGAVGPVAGDHPLEERDVFFDERIPRMCFVEQRYAGDPTNWWIPNRAATEAMLRSVGMRILERPCDEVYVCESIPTNPNSAFLPDRHQTLERPRACASRSSATPSARTGTTATRTSCADWSGRCSCWATPRRCTKRRGAGR